MLKVIDSLWVSTIQGRFGFVVGENEVGERKLYAGVVLGFSQKDDEQAILDWGNKINISLLEGLIARTKEKQP